MKNKTVGTSIARPHFEESAKRKNNGITLIALIITIIVMLILVAVSIRIALSTGLFVSAGKATKDWKKAQDEEQGLASGKVNIGGVWYDSIEDYVNNGNASSENIKINISMVNTPITVTADGTKVKEIKEGAPIPVDFYYVGGTMNNGIVISDSSADENKGADADLQGNQFVWVPVLQNQKLKIEVESKEAIEEIKVVDELLREIALDNEPSGKSYEEEVKPTINGTYTVTVTAGEKTVEKTLKVSSLYAQDFHAMTKEEIKADYTLEEFTQDWSEDGNIVEEWLEDEFGTTSVEEAYELRIQFWYEGDLGMYSGYSDSTIKDYANSVNTYGGFYIARYEAGSENDRTGSSDTTDTVYSKKNMYPYNYINKTYAIEKASRMYDKTNVTSCLVNAAVWDRTLNWLIETNAISTNEMLNDSTSWGNYKNSTFNFTGYYSKGGIALFTNAASSTLKPAEESYLLGTGVSDYTKRNNIYDLAGNCWEWTTETHSSGYVVSRRGDYTDDGGNYPVINRYTGGPSQRNADQTFRLVLYIN